MVSKNPIVSLDVIQRSRAFIVDLSMAKLVHEIW